MKKAELLEYFHENILKQGHYYTYQNIPQQIGNALYLYGDNHDFDIVIFIDLSEECDGSQGVIMTTQGIYFQFQQKGYIAYDDIQSLSLQMHRHQEKIGKIQTSKQAFQFHDNVIDIEKALTALSEFINMDIELSMNIYEKIEYYINIVLHDIENNEYEDLKLTTIHQQQIKELYENLHIIQSLDDENYQFELKTLCQQALQFFEELELDSDEIDELMLIQEQLIQKEEQSFDQAKQYYDDMIHKYQQGDTKMFDQLKGMMNMLGIHEEDFKNKTPEEMNQYIDDLCARFGISRSQVDQLVSRFQK